MNLSPKVTYQHLRCYSTSKKTTNDWLSNCVFCLPTTSSVFFLPRRGVVEASPPAGPTETPKIEQSSPAIEEVYAELARAQQGVMSLIVSTNSLPPQASNNGPYQQTSMKQHPIPCCELDEACLLYTSPSPRDGATSRMPSSA